MTSATLALATTTPGPDQTATDALWLRRWHIRESEEAYRRAAVDLSDLKEVFDHAVNDIDSVATMLTVRGLASLHAQGEANRRSRDDLREQRRGAEVRLERDLQRVNRRISLIASAFLLPSLWFAYWAVPHGSFAFPGRDLSPLGAQILVPTGGLVLGFVGFSDHVAEHSRVHEGA